MSMADFLWSMAASGGSEAVNLAILGSNAAADTVAELRDRGMDSTRAFALGAAAGLAEVVTESVSLETLLKPDRLADRALRYILKNTLAEAGEEASSDILNWAADALYDLLSGQSGRAWAPGRQLPRSCGSGSLRSDWMAWAARSPALFCPAQGQGWRKQ